METKEFTKTVNKFVNEIKGPGRKRALRKIAFALLREIVSNTAGYRHPVATGRARAGWHVAASKLGLPWSDEGSDTGAIAEGKARGDYRETRQYIDLINGVHYVIYLEYGHSTQAPFGMVRYNMRRMGGRALPETFNRELQLAWGKHFWASAGRSGGSYLTK
jgi:hypothetical protein